MAALLSIFLIADPMSYSFSKPAFIQALSVELIYQMMYFKDSGPGAARCQICFI
jgi:hypothetical protein